jgi:hypothetical protein
MAPNTTVTLLFPFRTCRPSVLKGVPRERLSPLRPSMEGKTFGVLFVIVALNCERSEMRRLLNQITFTRSWILRNVRECALSTFVQDSLQKSLCRREEVPVSS